MNTWRGGMQPDLDLLWRTALGDLRREIPRGDFDAWVRDTRLLSEEKGAFVVGVLNEYARQWCEDRLRARVEQALAGLTGRPARVRFVVMEHEWAVAEEPSPDTVEIRAEEYASLSERVVLPHRAVVLPGYFRRWIRVLGPDLAWLYVAFRQAAYLAGGRSGSRHGRFSGQQIARLCGINPATFWRRVKRERTWTALHGLVNREGEREWSSGPVPRQLPHRYSVAMTLPLTPGDAESLEHWLTWNVERYGGPEGVLQAAATADLSDLLPLPPLGEGPGRTVGQVVRGLFGDQLPEDTLEALASAIQDRIMPHNRDTIHISLFFLEHILPHLGAGPGWLLVLLRDRCWVDREEGKIRNRVTVRWGYSGMADWLGLSRPKTIWEWLRKHPVLQVYVREVTEEKASDFLRADRTFEVLLEEVPWDLLGAAVEGVDPDDLPQIGMARTGDPRLADFARSLAEVVAAGWRDHPRNGAIDTHGMARLQQDHGADASHGMARLQQDHGANASHDMARLQQDHGANATGLNLLTSKNRDLQPPEESPHHPLTPSSPHEHADGGVVVEESWDLAKLLAINRVDPRRAQELLEKGARAEAFVSWILYTYSPEGARIRGPVGYAISRLSQQPEAGAGGAWDRLAARPPGELLTLLRAARRGEWVEDRDFQQALKGLKPEGVGELLGRLFGA